MLPQKPSRKSQCVKPKRKTRKRAHAHLFSEPNPTSGCLSFPSLPSSLYASPFLWLWLGRVLRFMKQLRVAFAVRKQKHKQKQNKTKPTRIESRRVELSWTTRSEFEFNAKWPSSWPSWPTRLVAHSRLLQRCCVARWPMHKPRAQWSKTVSHLTNACLRILLMKTIFKRLVYNYLQCTLSWIAYLQFVIYSPKVVP